MADPQLVPVDHDPFAAAAPGLVPVDNDPFSTATPSAPLTPMQQKMYDVPIIGPATKFVDRLTDEGAWMATLGLSDKAGALGTATGKQLKGQNLADVIAGNPASFSDQYHQALGDQRAREAEFETDHPYAARGAQIAALPLAAGGAALDALAPAGTATLARTLAPTTMGGKIALGAKQGAVAGGTAGFAGTSDDSLAQDLQATGVGTVLGVATGAALPPIVENAVAPLFNLLKRGFGGANAVQSQALQRIALRVAQDQKAGGPTAQDMLDLINAGGGKPVTLADVGGGNVLGEAGRIARAPGPGKQYTAQFLTERDKGAGTRLMGDVDTHISAGGPTFDTAQALGQSRSAAAKPLYTQAYDSNQTILSPDITAVLQTPAGKKAMAQSSELMLNDGLVPSSGQSSNGYTLEQLDYAKRALDDQISAAQRGGNGNEGRILVGLKNRLLTAIDNADSTAVRDATGKITQPGAYSQARNAWSGPSQSMDALEAGSKALNQDPAATKAEFNALSPGDQEFYKLGAANALKAKIAATSAGGNEANRIVGSIAARNALRPLFPDDASFNSFIKSATTESQMFGTKVATVGNSPTAGRVAEDDTKASSEGGVGSSVAQLAAGYATGENIPTFTGAIGVAKNLFANRPPKSPEVNAAIARMLFDPDQAANQTTLAKLMAMGQRRPSMMTIPLAGLAGRAGPVVGPIIQPHLPSFLNPPAGQ